MGFTTKILAGLALGIAVGLFLGERAEPFRIGADVFVRLLEMTVLPYVTVSLVAGIGSLDPVRAKALFLRGGAVTIFLWALALGCVLLMPLAFPAIQTASFFSTTLVEDRPAVDLVSLYVPANPFHSLANSVVPAVVLFSVILGAALMGVEGKERLLESLRALEHALARANRLMIRLTPVGLLAIAAHFTGTVDFAEIARLRVYLLAYGAMALVLSLYVFPTLVACVTPIPASRVLHSMKDVLITAFTTGDLFVVLPTLVERSKELLAESGTPDGPDGGLADVLVPAFYNFPNAAKLLSLSFVPFAAWYSETALRRSDYARLLAAGVASLFGSLNAAIPFLLDLLRVPADTFQLFLGTSVLNSRFGTLAGAMHMVVLALVGTSALGGRLRLEAPRIVRGLVLGVGATAATVAALAVAFRAVGAGAYEGDRVAREMGLLRPPSERAVELKEVPDPLPPPAAGSSVLAAVRQRGLIRVGYVDGQVPYSFVNARGELVGFDVEMAYALAADLGVALELAPVPREGLAGALETGRYDVVMGGVFMIARRVGQLDFSAPYLDETLAFVVPDHRRADFSHADWVREQEVLRVAAPDLPFFLLVLKREFPNLEVVPVPMRDIPGLLAGRGEPVDALCLTAERGSFLTLLHPAFSVAVPHPLEIRLPLAYPVARHDLDLTRYLTTWVDIKKKDGTIKDLYGYWILGHEATRKRPRWSVLRNVLHWRDEGGRRPPEAPATPAAGS
jgi:Na+/H+-dicarboxylate symporter/ABC-type amino acid transport substrate-binding protein